MGNVVPKSERSPSGCACRRLARGLPPDRGREQTRGGRWRAQAAVVAAAALLAVAATLAASPPAALASAPGEKAAATAEVTESDLEARPSLEVVRRYAIAHNPAIRAARRAWEAARARIPQVRSYENPEVTLTPDTGNRTETRAGQQGNGVGIFQRIPFPGKLTLRGRVAEEEAAAAYERLQAVTQEVLRQVRARYADYYLAFRSLTVNADTTELVRQFAAIAEAKYRVGEAPQQDVIQAQEELSRLAAERVVFLGERETALGALNALLDRDPRAPIGAPGELEAEPLKVSLQELIPEADRQRPELRAQDHLVEARRRSLTLAKMEYLPDFRIGGQYIDVKGGTNPMFTRDGHDVWSTTVGLSIPIWVGRVKAGVDEARAAVLAEQLRRRDLGNRVHDELQSAYERVRVAARVERIYRDTLIPQTEERIGAARAGYRTGRVDFLTLINSLESLEEVRLEHYRAIRDYQRSLADLERAVGKPIAEIAATSGRKS